MIKIVANSKFKYDNHDFEVVEYIGAGAQAEVYKILMDKKECAFKYYFKENCKPGLRKNLLNLINSPIKSDSFIWPLFFIDLGDRFGYVMDLLPKGYKTVCQWISNEFDMSLINLFKVCLNLCVSFSALHAEGYSYKDISLSNITFNPSNGDIRILDNDNVTKNLESAGIIGTPKFMAPEIVAGLTKTPTRLTDLHSLAVLLFLLLHGEHPLNGKKEYYMEDNDQYDINLYGPNSACFIFKNPCDLNQYIVLEEQSHVNARDMFKMYPKEIQNMFRQTFVEGINNSSKRPQAYEWIEAFSKMIRELYFCPYCNSPMFFDKEVFDKNIGDKNRGKDICNACSETILLPIIRIELKKQYSRNEIEYRYVVINDNTKFYSSYFDFSFEKSREVFHSELKNGKLRFFNDTGIDMMHNNKIIKKGQYTDYINFNSLDVLYIEGKKCLVAFYK